MEKIKIEVRRDQKCPICKENFFDAEGKLVKAMNINSDLIGPAHDACFFPYYNEDKLKILYQVRCYSIGDTIASTPVLREIKRCYPRAQIGVLTFFPDLFKYNPHVNEIIDINQTIYDKMLDPYVFRIDSFNSDRGQHFAMHSIEFSAMSSLARSLNIKDWQYEVNYSDIEHDRMLEECASHGIDVHEDKVIVVHPHGTEWPTRDWGKKHFLELYYKIRDKYPDYKIVSIGGKRTEVPARTMNNHVELPGCIDLYGRFSLLESLAFLNTECVKLIVTPDTGALHIAGCTADKPIVGIFTLVRGEFRTPVRKEEFGYKFKSINADNPCCCTYTNRFLTNEAHFEFCPKQTFLKNTLKSDLPYKLKHEGMKNYDSTRNWDVDQINMEIREELKVYDNLPCYPTIEKVMRAIDEFLRPVS